VVYTLEEIKEDIQKLQPKEFFLKHLLRSNNWYFEKILSASHDEFIRISDEFKSIISKSLKISFSNIAIVGSGKLGYSLTPKEEKLYKSFGPESDIDVAIISSPLFHHYWDIFRYSYSNVNTHRYRSSISLGIYRGYIGEYDLNWVDQCRIQWTPLASASKKALYNDLYIKHSVNYRLYRSWEDLEDYHIQSIDRIKRGELNGSVI